MSICFKLMYVTSLDISRSIRFEIRESDMKTISLSCSIDNISIACHFSAHLYCTVLIKSVEQKNSSVVKPATIAHSALLPIHPRYFHSFNEQILLSTPSHPYAAIDFYSSYTLYALKRIFLLSTSQPPGPRWV